MRRIDTLLVSMLVIVGVLVYCAALIEYERAPCIFPCSPARFLTFRCPDPLDRVQ